MNRWPALVRLAPRARPALLRASIPNSSTSSISTPTVGAFSTGAGDVHNMGGWAQAGWNFTKELSLWGLVGHDRISSADYANVAATQGIKNALRAGYDAIEHGTFMDDEGDLLETAKLMNDAAFVLASGAHAALNHLPI